MRMAFGACETRKCVTVNIAQDSRTSFCQGLPTLIEELLYSQKLLMIIVSHRNSSSRKNVLICFSSSVIITVSYSATTYTASERMGTELTLLIVGPPTGGAPRSFTLVANTGDGTASRLAFSYNNILDILFIRSK